MKAAGWITWGTRLKKLCRATRPAVTPDRLSCSQSCCLLIDVGLWTHTKSMEHFKTVFSVSSFYFDLFNLLETGWPPWTDYVVRRLVPLKASSLKVKGSIVPVKDSSYQWSIVPLKELAFTGLAHMKKQISVCLKKNVSHDLSVVIFWFFFICRLILPPKIINHYELKVDWGKIW